MYPRCSLILVVAFALQSCLVSAWSSPHWQAAKRQSTPTVCNLHAELCSRSLGNITFAGAHDSFTNDTNPAQDPAADQQIDVTAQLDLGVRFLENQAHWDANSGTLRLCHTNCALLNGTTVQQYLIEVNAWLDNNPNDFVILLFTNDDPVSIITYWASAFNNSGILPKVLIPSEMTNPANNSQPYSMPIPRTQWPNLGDILATGKQTIVFMDTCADGSCGPAIGSVDYIFPEFQSITEDPFGDIDETFICTPNRTAGPLSETDHMTLANHVNNDLLFGSIMTSDFQDAPVVNSVESILAHADNCTGYGNGHYPNIVLADFVNVGDLIQAVDILNGFTPTYTSSSVSATSSGTTTSSATSTIVVTSSSAGLSLRTGWNAEGIWIYIALGVSMIFGGAMVML